MANMFALILVIATVVTGLLWCLDKFIFAPKRRESQAAAQAATGDQLDKKTLKKVEDEDFGYCESCGVEIGIRRLEARPTADLCIDCKTLAEIREKQMAG